MPAISKTRDKTSSSPNRIKNNSFQRLGDTMTESGRVIVKNDNILGGEPVFRNTRVPFQALLDYLEHGKTMDAFVDDFPTVSKSEAIAALEEAKALVVARLA